MGRGGEGVPPTRMQGRTPPATEGRRLPSQGFELPLQASHDHPTAAIALPRDRAARDAMVHSLGSRPRSSH